MVHFDSIRREVDYTIECVVVDFWCLVFVCPGLQAAPFCTEQPSGPFQPD